MGQNGELHGVVIDLSLPEVQNHVLHRGSCSSSQKSRLAGLVGSCSFAPHSSSWSLAAKPEWVLLEASPTLAPCESHASRQPKPCRAHAPDPAIYPTWSPRPWLRRRTLNLTISRKPTHWDLLVLGVHGGEVGEVTTGEKCCMTPSHTAWQWAG